MNTDGMSNGDNPQPTNNPDCLIKISDGSTITDHPVPITETEKHQLLPRTSINLETKPIANDSTIEKAGDLVSTILAKGFIFGKDAFNMAKSFDEKHQLTSNVTNTAASIDRKIGLSEKLSIGTSVVNITVKEMEERFQISEKAKSAVAAAATEMKASDAGSAIISNRFLSIGVSWVSSALNAVVKAAEGVSLMTKEKVERAEEEKREALRNEHAAIVNDFAHILLDQSLAEDQKLV